MRKLREKIYDDAAFTLIELLVVIAVLGILAGIAVPRITGVQDQAREEALNATASSVRNAMEMSYASLGEYPDISGVSTIGGLSAAISSGTSISVSLSGNDNINISSPSSNTTTFSISLSDDSGNSVTINENGVN